MNIILFTSSRGVPGSINLSRPRVFVPLLGVLALFSALLVYTGYQAGSAAPAITLAQAPEPVELRAETEHERLIDQVRRRSQAEFNALSMRMAQIQAQVIRIEGLGKRLVDLANLDRGEFNFGTPPAQGGPVDAAERDDKMPADILQELERLSAQIKDRERQLIVLEDIFKGHGISLHGRAAGSPVADGWLSSFFGVRTDPFTGRSAMHNGLDFAGKAGSPVMAIAAGKVIRSGRRDGYGNLVEIDHGQGYVTRYGHNQQNLVQVGQLVRKGQQIARMGSSGRSTGPHVHLEVLRDGQPVNPLRYLSVAADKL